MLILPSCDHHLSNFPPHHQSIPPSRTTLQRQPRLLLLPTTSAAPIWNLAPLSLKNPEHSSPASPLIPLLYEQLVFASPDLAAGTLFALD